MSRKLFFIFAGSMLTTFVLGWEAAMLSDKKNEVSGIAQAIPVIRFIRFDKVRNTLIIGLFNPGKAPLEVSRTELMRVTGNEIADTDADSYVNEYGDKPLVVDPGDTILIPLTKSLAVFQNTQAGSYRTQLDFRIPGQIYLFSIRHRFSDGQLSDLYKPTTN